MSWILSNLDIFELWLICNRFFTMKVEIMPIHFNIGLVASQAEYVLLKTSDNLRTNTSQDESWKSTAGISIIH